MAKPIRKKEKKRKPFHEEEIPLSRENYMIIGIALVVIIAGYVALMEGSVEGFLPLVLAPILLVLGYCVLIPFGILFKKSFFRRGEPGPTPVTPAGGENVPGLPTGPAGVQ